MISNDNSKENYSYTADNKSVFAILFAAGAAIFIIILSVLRFIQNSQSIGIDPLPGPNGYQELTITTPDGEEVDYKVEIADDPTERTKGLMYRTDINPDEGMLFVFPDAAERSFWMKDTPTSLDILYFDENRLLINFYESTIPNNDEMLYPSMGDSKYVVELLAGQVEEKKLQKGSVLTF